MSLDERPSRPRVWHAFLRPVPIGAAVLVAVSLLAALFAEQLSALSGNDPLTYHPEALGPDTAPVGALGGGSAQHWFGVEPGAPAGTSSRS